MTSTMLVYKLLKSEEVTMVVGVVGVVLRAVNRFVFLESH